MGGRFQYCSPDARQSSTLEQVLPSTAEKVQFKMLGSGFSARSVTTCPVCQEEPVTCKERPHEATLDGQLLQLAWVGIWPQLSDERRQQFESLQQSGHFSRICSSWSSAHTAALATCHVGIVHNILTSEVHTSRAELPGFTAGSTRSRPYSILPCSVTS